MMGLPTVKALRQRRWCTKCQQMIQLDLAKNTYIGVFDELGDFDVFKLSCPVCANGIAMQVVEFEEEIVGNSMSRRVTWHVFMSILKEMNQ